MVFEAMSIFIAHGQPYIYQDLATLLLVFPFSFL